VKNIGLTPTNPSDLVGWVPYDLASRMGFGFGFWIFGFGLKFQNLKFKPKLLSVLLGTLLNKVQIEKLELESKLFRLGGVAPTF